VSLCKSDHLKKNLSFFPKHNLIVEYLTGFGQGEGSGSEIDREYFKICLQVVYRVYPAPDKIVLFEINPFPDPELKVKYIC